MSKLIQIYLRFLIKIYLWRAKPKIIAITGSVGKTSAKDAIFEVLKIKFGQNIRKSPGNLNNETGVPLGILGFQKSPNKFWQWPWVILRAKLSALFGRKYRILVLEMAADKPGDLAYLTSFVRPDIAVLTAVGPAHLGAFGTIENVMSEKTVLIRALAPDGFAILNFDDEQIKKIAESGDWQKKTYAIKAPAEIAAKNITTEILDFVPQTKFQVNINSGQKFPVLTPTLGREANVLAALAAVSVADVLGIDNNQIIAGLNNFRPGKHRMEVVRGKNDSIIIDDSYNANPHSMRAALEVLRDLPVKAKKIAVLGDMLEIGKITDEAHQIIGEYAHEVADEVVAVGKLAKMYQGDEYFESSEEAAEYLLGKIAKDDIILIKASRAIGLEKVVEKLKSNGINSV